MNRYYCFLKYCEDKNRGTTEVTYKKSDVILRNEIPYHEVMEEYLKEKGLGEREKAFQGETLFLIGASLLTGLNNVFYLHDRILYSNLADKKDEQEEGENVERSITILYYKALEEKLNKNEIMDCLEGFCRKKVVFIIGGNVRSENFEKVMECLENLENVLIVFLQIPGTTKEEHQSLLEKGRREILEIPDMEIGYLHEVFHAVLESLNSPFEKKRRGRLLEANIG